MGPEYQMLDAGLRQASLLRGPPVISPGTLAAYSAFSTSPTKNKEIPVAMVECTLSNVSILIRKINQVREKKLRELGE